MCMSHNLWYNDEKTTLVEGVDGEGQEIMVPVKVEEKEEPKIECLGVANGCYTILNTKTSEHRTFRIRTAQNGGLKGKRIVALLSGPDNTNDYIGFAFLTETGIRVWGKHKGTKYDKYATFLWEILNGKRSPILQVNTEKYCARCNRLLTHPESCKYQIGPDCREKMGL